MNLMQKNIKNGFSSIKNIFISRPMFKQELLFNLALKEKGINPQKLKIKCDHVLGKIYMNGLEFGIKYPDSFYNEAIKLIPNEKQYDYYFNGNMSESGQRSIILQPFKNKPNSVILSSNEGRIQNKKDKFNYVYFSELAKSKFGLCPHQADWTGDKDYMWTYRFIESCFVESIPILFKEAPLGHRFIDGFFYLWNTDGLFFYDSEKASQNRLMAKEKFCITENECQLIQDVL